MDNVKFWQWIVFAVSLAVAFAAGISAAVTAAAADSDGKRWFRRGRKKYSQPTVEELTEEKFMMAEANIKMLEQKELLEAATEELKDKQAQLEAHKVLLMRQNDKMADINNRLFEVNEELSREKGKSEKLLLNILPPQVAEELKTLGQSRPVLFENVTVLFTDIVGFTSKSAMIPPSVLIGELNVIFTAFDNIIERNHCERIKTIGDAYLAISGINKEQSDHVANILKSALEIIEYLKERNKTSEHYWEVRAGVHTGSIVGGIVGVKKYIYDIFGDTVNTTSRLEQHSEPMKINVSSEVYALTENRFDFVVRNATELKGKGVQKMYFLEGQKGADDKNGAVI
jgi:class 3 adenylate cyclase